MADGFYTNEDDDIGCFGGYGSDGAWAYADDARSTVATVQSGYGSAPDAGGFGAFASNERRQKRFAGFRAGGSGGYGRAA